MSEAQLAWAAGFFDGEGSVQSYRQHPSSGGAGTEVLRVTLTQARREPLDQFADIVGEGKVYGRPDHCYYWVASHRAGREAMRKLRPHLVAKRCLVDDRYHWDDAGPCGNQWEAWLAGLVDAEGCLLLHCQEKARGYWLKLSVAMTDWQAIEHAHWVAGSGSRSERLQRDRTRRKYEVCWSTVSTLALLRRLRPYLIVKAAEADVALRYEALRGRRGIAWTPELIAAREVLRAELQSLKYRNRLKEG